MHEQLVNRLGGQSLARKSVATLSDHPSMILAVYHGGKIRTQQPLNTPSYLELCILHNKEFFIK